MGHKDNDILKKQSWNLDSTNFFYLRDNKDRFIIYKTYDEESLVSLDDHEIAIKGIDFFNIRMNSSMVKAFRNVRHVPNLNENLISFEILD